MIQEARQIIGEILYLTLATADAQGRPWCTPVFTAHDEDYNFYWASGFEARHSKNIRENERVGATVYDSRSPDGEGQAVYMDGSAQELDHHTWHEGVVLLRQRCLKPEKFYPLGQFDHTGPVRVYRFTPETFYMLNPDGDPRYDEYADCRVEIDMRASA